MREEQAKEYGRELGASKMVVLGRYIGTSALSRALRVARELGDHGVVVAGTGKLEGLYVAVKLVGS